MNASAVMQHDQDLAVAAAYASGNSHAQQRHMPYADTAHLHDFGEFKRRLPGLVSEPT